MSKNFETILDDCRAGWPASFSLPVGLSGRPNLRRFSGGKSGSFVPIPRSRPQAPRREPKAAFQSQKISKLTNSPYLGSFPRYTQLPGTAICAQS
jgi:hypothetical protein